MSIKVIGYNKYFQQSKLQKYESTRDVVDSLLQYDRLVNYRFYINKNNPHYWFLVNTLDALFSEARFHKKLIHDGRYLPSDYLVKLLTEFRMHVLTEYNEQVEHIRVIRDTIKLVNRWICALNKIK